MNCIKFNELGQLLQWPSTDVVNRRLVGLQIQTEIRGRMVGSGFLFLCLFGLCSAEFEYLSDKSKPPDSKEYGVTRGQKGTTCMCGITNKAKLMIENSEKTTINEYPHMAAVGKVSSGGKMEIFCGSTIISEYHALTAAHCTHGEQPNLIIVVGAHNLSDNSPHTWAYDVNYLNHKDYSPITFENDISILYTKIKIVYNKYVGPACMPLTSAVGLQGQWVKVTGWGKTRYKRKASDVLRKANMKVVSFEDCAAQYRYLSTKNGNQFCTYTTEKDSYQGDSGDSVIWLDPETNMYTLIGIVSYGKGCVSTTPGVNTDVYSHHNWIERAMAFTARVPHGICAKFT